MSDRIAGGIQPGMLCMVDHGTPGCESARGARVQSTCDFCEQPACKSCSIKIKSDRTDRVKRICLDCAKGPEGEDFMSEHTEIDE